MSVQAPRPGATAPSTTPPARGVYLTSDQVVALCWNMTGARDRVITAAAIILAESSGDTGARCYNHRGSDGKVYCGAPGAGVISTDRGLCQFNSVSHAELTDAECDDPGHAVAAMFHISHGFTDFHEWATYTAGTYHRYTDLTRASFDAISAKGPDAWTATLASIGGVLYTGGQDAAGAAKAVVKGGVSLAEFLAKITDPMVWHRVVFVVLGLAALVFGAFLLDRSLLNQVAGSAVTSAAGALASTLA